MRFWQKGISIFAIITISLTICACGSNDSQDTPEPQESQTFEVQRGNLTTMISAFGNVSMPHQANLVFGINGTVEELNAEFGDTVKKGDILAKLDIASLERSVQKAEIDLRTAQINLDRASSDANIRKAEAAVTSAKVSLASAEEALKQARDFTASDAETNLENAQRNLASARKNAQLNIAAAEEQLKDARDVWGDFVQANMEILEAPRIATQEAELRDDIEDAEKNLEIVTETADTSIATAETSLSNAERSLENAPVDVQQKEAAVISTGATLAQAENELAYVQNGLDIELLEINIDKALLAMEEAQDRLDDATIVAPFDGTIARVNIVIGDEVMASTIAMQLVNTTEVEIDADVDEIDVAKLEIGQNAEIDVDALQGTTLNGKVTAVSPVGLNQLGLITYDLTVEIFDSASFNLKDGMTASADIEAVIAKNAILIPKAAITRDRAAGIQTVTVVKDNGEEEVREVQTGASDGKLTEITSGLEEGDQIVSSVSINISRDSQGSSDDGDTGSGDVDVMACVGEIMGNEELTACFGKMMEMGEEMGIDPNEYGGEIPWDEIEYWANDDTGEITKDIKDCLNIMLENRDCLDALTKMAEEMGIDTSNFNPGDMGGFGGM